MLYPRSFTILAPGLLGSGTRVPGFLYHTSIIGFGIFVVWGLTGCVTTRFSPDATYASSGKAVVSAPEELKALDHLGIEIKIAREHSDHALRKPNDLDWIRRYMRHVRHAVEPSSELDGPGLSYGVIRTSGKLSALIRARESMESLDTQSRAWMSHVIRSTEKITEWAEEVMTLTKETLEENAAKDRVKVRAKSVAKLIQQMEKRIGTARRVHQAKAVQPPLPN